MRYLRTGLVGFFACMALMAPAAGAVVLKNHRAHRVSLMLRPHARSARLHGFRAVRSARAGAAGGGVLAYHGGPVLHSERPYLIFWEPRGHSIANSSKTVMEQYMADVAGDSGGANNVFGVLTQYSDATGSAAYQQSFGSAQVIDDTRPYPSNTGGCPLAAGLTACVTDAQLQTEIARLIAADHLGAGTGPGAPIYFVVTPQDVNECLSGTACESNDFCAYHDFFTDSGESVLYSAVPFAVWAGGVTKGCQTDGTAVYQTPDEATAQKRFFGDHAYQVADNLSHELSETITDPLLNAWFTKSNGSEVADLCEAFAPKSSTTKDVSAHAYFPIVAGTEAAGDLVDQFFSDHYYYNQTEWSNRTGDCMATPTT